MGANPSDPLFDQQAIDKYNLVAPRNLISMARLLLFGRGPIKATEHVLHVLALAARTSNNSWLAAVQVDVRFVTALPHFASSKIASFVGNCASLPSWANAFRSHKNGARMALMAFFKDPLTNRSATLG